MNEEEGITMKKFGFVGIVAGGLVAAVVGLASPAQADLSHNIWANQQNQSSQNGSAVSTQAHG